MVNFLKKNILILLILSGLLSPVLGQTTWSNKTKPGKANALLTENKIILENNVLKCSWDLCNNKLSITEIINHLTSEKINLKKSDPIQFILENGEVLRSSDFTIKDTPQITEAPLNSDLPCKALQIQGKMIETTLYSKKNDITILWRGILRDGSNYIKQEFTITTKEKLNISKLVLWELPYPQSKAMGTVRGVPIVSGNIFFGYEHPTSDISIEEEKGNIQNFTYDILIDSGQTVNANSIIGVLPKNQLRRAFLHYIERERAHPYHQFLHYISYYDMHYHGSGDLKRCDSDQFSEVIKNWRDKFILPYNVQFESFGFDDGWDDYENLWYIDRDLFPDEFKPQYELTKPFGSGLGFWLSPTWRLCRWFTKTDTICP